MKVILVNVMYLVLQASANDYADAEINTEKCDINTSIQYRMNLVSLHICHSMSLQSNSEM